MVTIKSEREIKLMREACRVVALTYDKLEKVIKPGMSTWELDQIAEKTMRELGAIPAEKGYDPGIRGIPPYPATLCVSINDEVIHGVPSKTKIKKMKAKGKGVTFNIKAVAGATGYNVMRSVSKTKGFAKAATIKAGQKLTFYDKKLKKGRKYYYKVIVFTTVKGTHYYGKYSKVKSFTRKK